MLYALVKESDYHKSYAVKALSLPGIKYTSVVTLLELQIVAKRDVGDAFSLDIDKIIVRRVPFLKIYGVSPDHFEKSTELRQKYGLGIFDSIHVAVCLEKDGEIASTDHAFNRIPGLIVIK